MIEYRTGETGDTEEIAKHMLAASGGVFEYLLEGILPGCDLSDILAISIASPESSFFYGNCIIAEQDGACLGVLNAYPSEEYGKQGEIHDFIPEDRVAHLSDLMNSKIDGSYYINTLSVDEIARRKGIGGQLIKLAVDIARDQGSGMITLHVWGDNDTALRLYRNAGFETYEVVHIAKAEHLEHEGHMLLIGKNI